jgi:hypothetical protein
MKKVVLMLMLVIGVVSFGCQDPPVEPFGQYMEGQYNQNGEPLFRVNPGMLVVEYQYPSGRMIKIITNGNGSVYAIPNEYDLKGDSRVILYEYEYNKDICAGYMSLDGEHIKSKYDLMN